MTSSSTRRRTGLWLIGARGSVATTTICGLLALRAGWTRPIGCVTAGLADELPGLAGLLPGWEEIVVGGHDLLDTPLDKRAEALAESGVLPASLFAVLGSALAEVDAEIRPGYDPDQHRGTLAAAVARLVGDIEEFRGRHRLDRVVVLNVSTAQPPAPAQPAHADLDLLVEALSAGAAGAAGDPPVLPPSAVGAYAALTAGCPYVDFTPSPGMRLPALAELALRQGLPYAGSDGKTGETLVRSALAPMFAARALAVRSWSGTNLLGGGDGANLADPVRAAGKLASKGRSLAALLGAEVTAPLHIDYVPDLGEQKVAWDHVSVEGFLGSRMTLAFTWSGYDSALAAPLVLDLARLVAAAHAAGEIGPLGGLAMFFKEPLGSAEHSFPAQVRDFRDWAGTLGTRR